MLFPPPSSSLTTSFQSIILVVNGQQSEVSRLSPQVRYSYRLNSSCSVITFKTGSTWKSAGEDEPIPVKPPINDDDDGHVMNVPVLPPVLQEITGSQVDKSDSDSIMDEIEQHRSSLNARSDEVDPEPESPVKNESLELSDSFMLVIFLFLSVF